RPQRLNPQVMQRGVQGLPKPLGTSQRPTEIRPRNGPVTQRTWWFRAASTVRTIGLRRLRSSLGGRTFLQVTTCPKWTRRKLGTTWALVVLLRGMLLVATLTPAAAISWLRRVGWGWGGSQ